MFGMFGRLLGRSTASAAAGPCETFGEVEVPRAVGDEILQATPERRSRVRAIRDRLEYLSKDEKVHLIDRVLSRFAIFVFDLPASERYHHARRFGLLDHSLEVAWKTVLKLSETSFRISQDPLLNHKERPAWIYSGLLAALGHDAGKVLDYDVALPDSRDRWEREREPLAAFCLRNGLTETGPLLWLFQEGRGEHGHKGHAHEVLSRILTPEAGLYLGTRLTRIFEHYAPWATGVAPRVPPDPIRRLLEVVRHYDQESARLDSLEKKERVSGPPVMGGKAASEAEVPKTQLPAPPAECQKEPSLQPKRSAREETASYPEPPDVPALDPAPPHPEAAIVAEAPAPTRAAESEGDTGPIFSKRRGDPGEVGRRLEVEFEPVRLLDTLRRMISMRRLSRNGLFTDVYVRPDFVWIIFPRAFRRLAHLLLLPFDRRIEYRCRRAAALLPGVLPLDPGSPLVPIHTSAECRIVRAIRMRSQSLFSERDLANLGYAVQEVTVRPGEYRSLVVAGNAVDP